MKNIYIICLSVFVFTSTLRGQHSDIKVPLSDPGKEGYLHIYIHSGDIKVIGENRSDVSVSYDMDDDYHRGNKKSGRNGLRRIGKPKAGLEITEKNNRVEIDCETHSNELDIVIKVPLQFNLDLGNHNGDDISVENITGEVNIESHNSDISAYNISGYVNASTYNGDVVVTFNNIPDSRDMSFGSYNGDIDLSIPSNFSSNFKLKSYNGEVLSDLDLEEVSKTPELKSSNNGSFKLYTDAWTYAKLNNGGNEIKINTHNGDILIRSNE